MSVPAAPDVLASDRAWLSAESQARETEIRSALDFFDGDLIDARIAGLIAKNRAIHDDECINLNPASNVMNPKAEAALAAGLTTRASLGHPGAKYEMGLEAIEEIEVIATELACRVFDAKFAELRVGSGALANLYAFMATCRPGDSILVPPATIGGHVTHRAEGAAGLYGLKIHEYRIDPDTFTVDLPALTEQAERVQPKLITIGTSLNLLTHPVAAVRQIADLVGANVLFDAAHACGLIAGRAWPNPLSQGADLMTMSTYKSLGGPAGGLVLTNRADLAERIDAIAYPGLTANFDAGKTAALAITLLDWLEHGKPYAEAMLQTALALGQELEQLGLPLYKPAGRHSRSHQIAIDATLWGGGHAAAVRLREANLLACAIGLPISTEMIGLRLGTPEIVRLGMSTNDMPELAALVSDALTGDAGVVAHVAQRSTAMRRRFPKLHFVRC